MAQRRTHNKSKLGCQNCKRRHIKCDEGRPECRNCTNTKRQCVYLAPRPRRVQSASPTSTAISPSLALLQPVSAASTETSTPFSFAASPVFTPASIPQSMAFPLVKFHHMKLLNNFIFEVASSLDNDYSLDHGLLRSMMSVVLSKPFLLLQALAFSALHLSRTECEQADVYLAESTSLQIEALTLFDSQFGSITSDNCEATLLFATFLGLHSLGEAVASSESDTGGFLDRFVAYLNFHRGVQIVISQAWAFLMQASISPLLHHATDQLSLAAPQNSEQATFVATKLDSLLNESVMGEDSNTACRDAVNRLQMIYQFEDLGEHPTRARGHSSRLIWAWPILLSGTYIDLLHKRQPEALIILCYFAVLLHRRRGMWFIGGAGRLLIESITKSLGSYWRHWLDWPNDMIGT